ncbi:MAG: RluA family pseudouridine synthase [Phycisphaerales bacterium]
MPQREADLTILAATDDYAVVDKPPGLLSVPGKGPDKQDCVPARVRARFPHATGPLIVHRLDMDTSGLLVVGLNPRAQANLSLQFEQRRVFKRYIALLDGIVAHADHGEVDAPLRLDVSRRPYQVFDWLHGRPALTRWGVLTFEIDRTRVSFEPLTGRTHQLRVHAALRPPIGIGHPILGDPLYGSAKAPPVPRLMLHAAVLRFSDPSTNREVEFTSAPGF